ncbi:hypothetical protein L1987_31531 [Smallanthus sonchifolius]|uniref:Uncharacterized protein n=1 Tax=Smallanthus sonchifolius TaxID=185202 RepID=A0ACB9I7A0_9ASTR|nr:hypothetical protein L1987_31531 [Smallanthus sonchifolius]
MSGNSTRTRYNASFTSLVRSYCWLLFIGPPPTRRVWESIWKKRGFLSPAIFTPSCGDSSLLSPPPIAVFVSVTVNPTRNLYRCNQI